MEEYIRQDAAAGRFASWTHSTVIDEYIQGPIIERDTFAKLHALADIPARFPVGNAGLIHVYGYWLSAVHTPFGYKRDRWSQGHLAAALGQPRESFWLDYVDSVAPGSSTPLQRVTDACLPLLQAPPAAGARTADALVEGVFTRVVVTRPQNSPYSALVYGIDPGDGMRLVTTFPISEDPSALLSDFSATPSLRWNAAVLDNR